MAFKTQSTRQPPKRKSSSQIRASSSTDIKATARKKKSKDKAGAVATASTSHKMPLRTSSNAAKSAFQSEPREASGRGGPGNPTTTTTETRRPLMFPPRPPPQEAFPGAVYQYQDENLEMSQLSQSQASGGLGSVTLGQKSFSQSTTTSRASAPASHPFALHSHPSQFQVAPTHFGFNTNGGGSGGGASQPGSAFMRTVPPRPPMTMAPQQKGNRGGYFGKPRSAAFGDSVSFLPPELSSVGPNCKFPFMQGASAAAASSFVNHGFSQGQEYSQPQQQSQETSFSSSTMPSQSQKPDAGSLMMQAQSQRLNQQIHQSKQPPFTAASNGFSQPQISYKSYNASHQQSAAARSFDNKDMSPSPSTIGTNQVTMMTKEVSDFMETTAKSLIKVMEEKAHACAMDAETKSQLASKALDKRASKVTESMETMTIMIDNKTKLIEGKADAHLEKMDIKMAASESLYKKHAKMLDEKAKEIYKVGTEFVGTIKKTGTEIMKTAHDAGEYLQTAKSNCVKSVLSRLEVPAAKLILKLAYKEYPSASLGSPVTAVSSHSASESKKGVGSAKESSRVLSIKKETAADSKLSPLSSREIKKQSPSSHPNPLDIVVKTKRSSSSKGESPLVGKGIKNHSSTTSCITPSEANKSIAGFSQESQLTDGWSPKKHKIVNDKTRPEANKRRRGAAGGGRRRGSSEYVLGDAEFGFSQFA